MESHSGQTNHSSGQQQAASRKKPACPKYALFDGSLFALQETIPHIAGIKPSVIFCTNETGEHRYATAEEWLDGARQFIDKTKQSGIVTSESSAAEKIAFFKSLFHGRSDVFAHGYRKRDGGIGYTPACANEWKRGTCPKCANPKAPCPDCPSRSFLPLDDRVLLAHIKGTSETFKDVVALYPIDADGKVSFLAADFDKDGWKIAIAAYRDAACSLGIDIAIERSRSGNGGHAWIFFSEPVPAKLARDLGSVVITQAMRESNALSFDAYDRFFPAQDTIPKGGFGNAIALPFQGKAQRSGNSIFVDDSFEPYSDQWIALSRIKKVAAHQAQAIVDRSEPGPVGDLAGSHRDAARQVPGIEPQFGTPWSIKSPKALSPSDFPHCLEITKADLIYVPQAGLSYAAADAVRRLGAFGNPEFYRAQAMHQSVYRKHRIIYLGEMRDGFIALPRGCEERLRRLLERAGADYSVDNKRYTGRALKIEFLGKLRDEQKAAADKLLSYEDGILSAPTGFGKTVIGAYLISQVKLPCLVVVPKTALISQWVEKLESFLDVQEEPKPILTPSGKISKRKRPKIGAIGGGKNKPSDIVDVATFQSLVEKRPDGTIRVKPFVREYGLVICDECHHSAAPQLERVLKGTIAQRVYGLSATPKRADGLDQALFMLCGPIRCKIDPKEQAHRQGFERILIPHFTNARFPQLEPGSTFNQVLDALCKHKARNALIVGDVSNALDNGRMPLVVTKRKTHARLLADSLEQAGKTVRLLVGEGSPRQRKERLAEALDASEQSLFAVVATESYLGEGFDMPRLDALFLATPVSWDGNVTQQSGRLHREHEGKTAVYVHDYVDTTVPMLERMYKRRLKAYASLGYTTAINPACAKEEASFIDARNFRSALESDIRAATRSIVLYAPFASVKFVRSIGPVLTDAVARGAHVSCVICKPAPFVSGEAPADQSQSESKSVADSKNNELLSIAVSELEATGCAVSFDENAPSGLAVFDDQIVWYGSLSLLTFPQADDCSLRFKSAEIAHEITGIEPKQNS